MDSNKISLAAFLLLFALPVTAQDEQLPADESWITITGTATETEPDRFTLNYGNGGVVVEMGQSRWYKQDYQGLEGRRVTVNGEVDDDFFETSTIEASSVFVPSMNTYFYSDSARRSDGLQSTTYDTDDPDSSEVFISGTVVSVDGRKFTIDRGRRAVEVDTSFMEYDPMDDDGFQKIEIGDRVRVEGRLEPGMFTGREMKADWITTLREDEPDE